MATSIGLQRVDSRDTRGPANSNKETIRHGPDDQAKFRHEPLEDNMKQIRLCEVRYDPDFDRLAVDIQVYALDAVANHFDALSYVCGEPAKVGVSIMLNAERQMISRNVYRHLRRILDLGWTGKIWADALSIDSSNEVERCAQLDLMGMIYGGANQVFIGLDDESGRRFSATDDHAVVANTFQCLLRVLICEI